jgi:hypothetical protein
MGMDIAPSPWLNPVMRCSFLALGGFLALALSLQAQDASPPLITQHPPGVTAYVGDMVTLSAGVTGAAPLTFQWQKNSV